MLKDWIGHKLELLRGELSKEIDTRHMPNNDNKKSREITHTNVMKA